MKKREIELDLLRIIAMFTVILVHCSAIVEQVRQPGIRTFYSILSTLYTWEIPVFVMISGRFFLDPAREMPFAKIKHAVLRIAASFLVWNVLYQGYFYFSGSYSNLNWKGILTQALEGPFHFWFLFMIAGLYLITPFLRLIAKRKRLTEYFLLLFFFTELFSGYLVDLPLFGNGALAITEKGALHFVTGFSGCYLLGYYLHENTLSTRKEILLYCAAAVLMAGASIATMQKWYPTNADPEYFIKYLKPNIIIVAAAVYVFFTKRVSRHSFSAKGSRLIAFLSEHSFGIYLSHAFVISLLWNVELLSLRVFPVLVLPEFAFRVFLVSLAIAFVVRKIPKIGRLIT
jgi:surface polysaccharide O-acyltransferase-like enzyme